MDALIAALQEALPGVDPADLQIEVLGGTSRIGGIIIWDGFEGLSQRDRQKRVWDVIRKQPADLQKRMAPIITLTHTEVLVEAA